MLGARVDSEFWASSGEAWWAGESGRVASYDPESEVVASFDLVEWADSEPKASSEPEATSEPETDLDDVPVSACSSSYCEAVTTLDSTFLGVSRVALAAGVGVWVPGGTYSGSHSSSDEPIIQRDGSMDLDHPLE